MKKKTFLRKLIDPNDHQNSSKRFVTLTMAFHFIFTSFFFIFVTYAILFKDIKANIEFYKTTLDVLKDILLYDFGVIAIGLGFITAEQFTRIIIEKFRATAPPNIYGGYGMNNYNIDDDKGVVEGVVDKTNDE